MKIGEEKAQKGRWISNGSFLKCDNCGSDFEMNVEVEDYAPIDFFGFRFCPWCGQPKEEGYK